MAYSLSNKCAKNLCKRTVLVQLIFESVVACFLRHSVVMYTHVCVCVCVVSQQQKIQSRTSSWPEYETGRSFHTAESCDLH